MRCAIISDGTELSYECKNECEPPLRNLKHKILEQIVELFSQGYNTFITNCEYGIPLWSSEIVAAMKMYNDIRLDVVIPYEEQTTNWTEEQRDRYYSVHEASDSVYLSSTGYSEDCYSTAYQYMIEKSDAVIVFCSKAADIYAVSYAKAKNRRIIIKEMAEKLI